MADACMCSASQGKDLNFRDRLKRTPSMYHGLAALSSLHTPAHQSHLQGDGTALSVEGQVGGQGDGEVHAF